jgi:hypothetical protein
MVVKEHILHTFDLSECRQGYFMAHLEIMCPLVEYAPDIVCWNVL